MAIFSNLPDELFRPLAAPNRRLYAALLLHLHRKTFDVVGDAPRKSDVISDIGDFIEGWEASNGLLAEEDGLSTVSASPADRRSSVYQRLVETGWLVEYRDRYLMLVDFDPEARLLLQELSRIDVGETRSYGGAVLHVLGALESAAANPSERSEAIRNASRSSKDFAQHMRTVSASMRKIEERIVSQDRLREVFRSYFEDFVERHLITDFKTLHTKNNPFRFRSAIIRKSHEIAADPLTLRVLGSAYFREGRASSEREGEAVVLRELDEIARIFENIDHQLRVIDDTNARLERRIANAVRYMDRVNDRRIDRVTEAIRAVAAAPVSLGDIVEVSPAISQLSLPIGPPHIPAPRAPRPDIGVQRVRRVPPDPALIRWQEAKTNYQKRVSVTERGLEEFLERSLGRHPEIRASDIPLSSVDDFVVFQRLRELPFLFGGKLSERYEVVLTGGQFRSDWICCPDFIIRRRARLGTSHAA